MKLIFFLAICLLLIVCQAKTAGNMCRVSYFFAPNSKNLIIVLFHKNIREEETFSTLLPDEASFFKPNYGSFASWKWFAKIH